MTFETVKDMGRLGYQARAHVYVYGLSEVYAILSYYFMWQLQVETEQYTFFDDFKFL